MTCMALTDPLGVMRVEDKSGQFVLSPSEWELARRFDGEQNIADLVNQLAPKQSRDRNFGWQWGDEASHAFAAALHSRLGAALCLDNEARANALDARLDAFRSLPIRLPIGVGTDYEADPMDLRIRVAGLVANDWDMPPVPSARAAIAPSTHFNQTGALYARTYAALRETLSTAARVLLLGAVEAELEHLLVPLAKNYRTPFGDTECDRAAVAALATLPGMDELAHGTTCILERHCLFLRVVAPKLPIVPILVGDLPSSISKGELRGLPRVESAVGALRRVLELPGKTIMICSSDLQRIPIENNQGQPSGQAAPYIVGGDMGADMRRNDTACVDAATRIAADEFWESGNVDGKADHARCSIATYLFLRALEAGGDNPELAGSTLGYQQVPAGDELRTAVSVVFH